MKGISWPYIQYIEIDGGKDKAVLNEFAKYADSYDTETRFEVETAAAYVPCRLSFELLDH